MLMVEQIEAQVERPVACSGKGQYMAIVHYGSPGGDLYRRVFKYSHKDPRYKDDAVVLRDILQMIGSRYRKFVLAISVVKRCLHPKTDQVPKSDRSTHVERVFSWVVDHDSSVQRTPQAAYEHHLDDLLHGQTIQTVVLPYTKYELQKMPVHDIVTTTYMPETHATIGLRGVERRVYLRELLAHTHTAAV